MPSIDDNTSDNTSPETDSRYDDQPPVSPDRGHEHADTVDDGALSPGSSATGGGTDDLGERHDQDGTIEGRPHQSADTANRNSLIRNGRVTRPEDME